MKEIILIHPRGFCAGVTRAVEIVEQAIKKYGPPIYVRHEIVHNEYVVENLKAKGAIFVDELHYVPSDRPVVFSAHGVAKSVFHEARSKNMHVIDATCPLVSKVHKEVELFYSQGIQIILIGHKGHVEVMGTMGQAKEGAVILVQNISDIDALPPFDPVAYVTQTTLSVDETEFLIDALKQKFPHIQSPPKKDICYATTNRQEAIKAIASTVDLIIVIGSTHSSNSKRLVETAKHHGCLNAVLCLDHKHLDWDWINPSKKIAITAGASAPEELVQDMLRSFQERYLVQISNFFHKEELMIFHLPKELRD